MSIPLWALLAFTLWTLAVLVVTVGVYRWTRILTRRVPITEFRHDALAGHADWYRRAMRAHGNCVENLPVFGAVVLIASHLALDTTVLDALALVFVAARACQTVVHVGFVETTLSTSVCFTFFFAQVVAVIGMSWTIVGAGV